MWAQVDTVGSKVVLHALNSFVLARICHQADLFKQESLKMSDFKIGKANK